MPVFSVRHLHFTTKYGIMKHQNACILRFLNVVTDLLQQTLMGITV